MSGISWPCFMTVAAGFSVSCAAAEDAAVKSSCFGYDSLAFKVEDRACILVMPTVPAPGKPWIWRTEFFGHEPQADIALLGKGFHVAYMNMENLYGGPSAMALMDAFHAHLTAKYGLSSRVVLEGFSRGGLFAFNWAERNPEKVSCVYGDAPVCDFKSWPGGKVGKGRGSAGDWSNLLAVYGLAEPEALAYPLNPVDNLRPMAEARIPILIVCGAADDVVPVVDNSGLLAERYRAMGGEIKVISKPSCGHHPHSLPDPAPIVDFILRHIEP
jgi:pimeloyl-ACP methyl ester carboxylesterase